MYVSVCFFLVKLLRQTQSDLHTNQTSIKRAEEGAYNTSVLAKQPSSSGKKHLGQKLNIPENPYIIPGALLPAK